MKSLRQLCVAVMFTLALSISTFAGGIEIGAPSPPPPQSQTATTSGDAQTTIPGQEETVSGEVSATDSATEVALNLLQTVLALF